MCGEDALTGQTYDHRRLWLQDRMACLSQSFALDVLASAIMSDRLLAIIRTRPDIATSWSNHEVIQRWWPVYPGRRDQRGRPVSPTEIDLEDIQRNPDLIIERRRRLCSISWFMKSLCEPLARLANREDGCRGHFWEGRLRCQPLPDEDAVLARALEILKIRLAEHLESRRCAPGDERLPESDQRDSASSLVSAAESAQKSSQAFVSRATPGDV